MAGKLKTLLAGGALGVACTVLAFLLAQPARTLLSRLARLAGRQPRVAWMDPEQRAPSGTKYRTFYSQTARHDVSYLIYLPPAYDREVEKRYPVIYWLHSWGATEQEGAYTFVPKLDAAIRAGQAPPAIIVLPNGLPYIPWTDTSDGKLPVASVLIRDLIPHIDSSYRTLASRRNRAIEGFSMGGLGAVRLGFKYPELFGVIALDSAALIDENNDDAYLDANGPWNLAVRNAGAIRGRTAIRMAVGRKDSLLAPNRSYHLLLTALGIGHEYSAFDSVGHDEEGVYLHLGPRLGSFYAAAFSSE